MENTRRLKNVSLRNSLNNGRKLLFISIHCTTWQINESTLPLPNARSGSIKPTTLPLWTDGVRALSFNFVSCHSEELGLHNIAIVFILKKGKTVEEIADDLEENIEVVKQIYGNINAVGINKNLEVIIEQLTMK